MASNTTSVLKQSTGSAPIVRQGHTADDTDGAYPTAGLVGRTNSVRDLNAG